MKTALPNTPTIRKTGNANLATKEFAAVKYLIPGLISDGLTLLGGKPKIGKSWMALEIAQAVADQEDTDTLGRTITTHGEVLYAALEDNERRLHHRTKKLHTERNRPPNNSLCFATQCPRIDEGLIEALDNWHHEATDPKLVIFDTLQKIRPAKPRRGNLYEIDYEAIEPIQKWALEKHIAVLAITHLRKTEAEDPIDAVTGSAGITGCADTTLVLLRDHNGTTLHVRGRDVEESEHAAQFDQRECRWHLLGNPTEARRSDTRRNVLTAIKAAAPELISPNEIVQATGLERTTVQKQLARMLKAGEIFRNQLGLYGTLTE